MSPGYSQAALQLPGGGLRFQDFPVSRFLRVRAAKRATREHQLLAISSDYTVFYLNTRCVAGYCCCFTFAHVFGRFLVTWIISPQKTSDFDIRNGLDLSDISLPVSANANANEREVKILPARDKNAERKEYELIV